MTPAAQRAPDGRAIRAEGLRRERRKDILSAATRVFGRKGYLGTSIKDIVTEAGIARATFYAHFDAKRSVFEEILSQTIRALDAAIAPVDVDADVSWREQLILNIARCLDVVLENESLARILLLQAEGFDTDFDEQVHAFYQGLLGLIGRSLRKGAALGWINGDDPDLQAALVLGAIRQAVIHEVFYRNGGPRPRRALAEAILQFSVSGVLG